MSSPARSMASAGLQAAPVDGRLHLQVCSECASVQYPPRERCPACLSDALAWQAVDGRAEVLAVTQLQHSHEPWFAARLPWTVASLKLAAGPVVFAHAPAALAIAGLQVRVANARDAGGGWCLVACPLSNDDAGALHAVLQTLEMEP